ncbi:sulfurtransferase [Fictibacillus aquaticus]|uniref:Sulfurtransferase n=1 Tax=Fictibacillus aquaticus TaxID=2021314 RepID=A0A235FBL6_9BACL|nr:sulfurtransferase [Fictibacillus aquaticus]OYD58716.1 sulfurtransferase [Fictibacillus aquaticus]
MSHFVKAQWLAEHLSSPDIILIDCRFSLTDSEEGYELYVMDHIKGAFYASLETDLSGPVNKHGGRHPLPDVNILSQFFGSCGISPEKIVVAYDDSQNVFASRIWWLLRYMGHDNVKILKEGYTHYKEKGFPVSTKMPSVQNGVFNPEVKAQMACDKNHVLQASESKKPGTVLIDSREQPRYAGIHEPIDHKAGHIPWSVNMPYAGNIENGIWKTEQELKKRFSPISEKEEIIVYCGSGVTACVNLLAMAESGIDHAKLYPGSWSDWISYPENKIEKST